MYFVLSVLGKIDFDDDLMVEGFWLDGFTYATLINGLCRIVKTRSAIKLLQEMERQGIKLDVVAYCTIIDGLCKDGLIFKAHDLCCEMIKQGILPNIVDGASLWKEANAFCKEGRNTEAQAVFAGIMNCGQRSNVTAMEGYCLINIVNESKEIFDRMVKGDLTLNIFGYIILINGYCKIKMVVEAMGLSKEVHRINMNALIDGLSKGKNDKAKKPLHETEKLLHETEKLLHETEKLLHEIRKRSSKTVKQGGY